MSKLRSEDVLRLLKEARPDQVDVIDLPDGSMEIHFIIPARSAKVPPQKGKWARVADKMGEENFLGNGRGDRLRKAIREFRGNFGFRDVFSDSQDK